MSHIFNYLIHEIDYYVVTQSVVSGWPYTLPDEVVNVEE